MQTACTEHPKTSHREELEAARSHRQAAQTQLEEATLAFERGEQVVQSKRECVAQLDATEQRLLAGKAERLAAWIRDSKPGDPPQALEEAESAQAQLVARRDLAVAEQALEQLRAARCATQLGLGKAEAAVIAAENYIVEAEIVRRAEGVIEAQAELARRGVSLRELVADELYTPSNLLRTRPAIVQRALAILPMRDDFNTPVNELRDGLRLALPADLAAARSAVIASSDAASTV